MANLIYLASGQIADKEFSRYYSKNLQRVYIVYDESVFMYKVGDKMSAHIDLSNARVSAADITIPDNDVFRAVLVSSSSHQYLQYTSVTLLRQMNRVIVNDILYKPINGGIDLHNDYLYCIMDNRLVGINVTDSVFVVASEFTIISTPDARTQQEKHKSYSDSLRKMHITALGTVFDDPIKRHQCFDRISRIADDLDIMNKMVL